MKTFALFRRELCRLLRSPAARIIMLLTCISPVAGLTIYRPLYSTGGAEYSATMQGFYIGNPALAGGLAGGILFAVLTVLEMDRIRRSGMNTLAEAAVSPLTMALLQLASLACAAALTQLVTLLLWLPYTMLAVGAVFDGAVYLFMYLLGMLGGMLLSVLLASAAYQLTQRADLTLVLYAAMAGLSLTVWSEKWLLRWINPCVWALSDDFTNNRLLLSVAWQRLVWLSGLSGVWALSYLCVRRYGKGAPGSLLCNARRAYRPLIAMVLLACSVTAYIRQPLVDHSEPLIGSTRYYQTDDEECITCADWSADVVPNLKTGGLRGTAVYHLQNSTGKPQTVHFSVNPGYEFTSVSANGSAVSCTRAPEEKRNEATYAIQLPPEPEIELVIEYGGYPRSWNLTDTMQGEPEISDRYIILENGELNPSPSDIAYQGKTMSGTVRVTLADDMALIPFGTAKAKLLQEGEGTRTWQVQTKGFRAILYGGDYVSRQIKAQNLTVEFYYGRKHESILEQANAEGAVQSVINYCTKHYGPLSFYADGTLKLIQRRVAGGGYAGYGVSTMDEIDFTAKNLENSEKGSGSADVMIHELVHQWWGMGNMFDSEDSAGAWSSEGLTVYTTYRILKEKYGEQWAMQNYVEKWRQAYDDYKLNFYVRNPEYLNVLPEKYQADIANSLSTVRQYDEMPLKILKAEQLVGGEAAMDRILSDLFTRELDPGYPYLTYQNFLDACGLTEEDLELD